MRKRGVCANSNGDGGGGGSTIGSGIREWEVVDPDPEEETVAPFQRHTEVVRENSVFVGGSGSGGAYGTGGQVAPAKNNGYPGNPR